MRNFNRPLALIGSSLALGLGGVACVGDAESPKDSKADQNEAAPNVDQHPVLQDIEEFPDGSIRYTVPGYGDDERIGARLYCESSNVSVMLTATHGPDPISRIIDTRCWDLKITAEELSQPTPP